MSSPVARPIPTFIADSPTEGPPYGRWAERLAEAFTSACREAEDLPEGAGDPGEIRWFPERRWGGRVWVPAVARESGDRQAPLEYVGHVSFVRPADGGEPRGIQARVEVTDETADENPDWRIDINDAVIGSWAAEGEVSGDVTLVWGSPLTPGAVAATAVVRGETVDQVYVTEGGFTLVAVDAIEGYGDQLLLEVAIFGKRGDELARESLYADGDEEDEGELDDEAGPDAVDANGNSGRRQA